MFARVKRLYRDLVAGVATLFFPSRCRACGAELDGAGPALLCGECRAALAAAPAKAGTTPYLLRDGARAPEYARHPYDGPAGAAVRLLKFDGRRRLAPLLAAALAPLAAAVAREYGSEVIVPVPLHRRRRRERGFNQSELIGVRIAKELGLEFRGRGLGRVRYTRPQVELPAAERLTNVKGAFAARDNFTGRRVMLIDDVITTGATVRECAAVLRDAGATGVVCAAVAGGIRDYV